MEAGWRWVALPENRSAQRAIKQFAAASVQSQAQPLLLLHGPPGSGKTHLVGEVLKQFFTQGDSPENQGGTAQTIAAADLGRELQLPTMERRDLIRSLSSCD